MAIPKDKREEKLTTIFDVKLGEGRHQPLKLKLK
jgi:hypothetical protein